MVIALAIYGKLSKWNFIQTHSVLRFLLYDVYGGGYFFPDTVTLCIETWSRKCHWFRSSTTRTQELHSYLVASSFFLIYIII